MGLNSMVQANTKAGKIHRLISHFKQAKNKLEREVKHTIQIIERLGDMSRI